MGGVAGEVISYRVGELIDYRWKVLLGKFMWPCLDVYDPKARLDFDCGRNIVGCPSSENCGPTTGLRKCRSDLAHIDVHTPAVTRPRLDQR